MTQRVLGAEATQRHLQMAQALHAGLITKPAYIDAWQTKLDEAIQRVAHGLEQKLFQEGDDTFKLFVHKLSQMKKKKERLYSYWVEGTQYRTWNELATGAMPTTDELFFLAVMETEDYFTEPRGIATFVQYLDHVHAPGVQKDFTHACLRDCDPLLAEEVVLTPEIIRTFTHPEQVFGTSTKEVLEERLNEWCRNTIPHQASSYVQRIFIANILTTQGDFLGACEQMEYARAEAAEPRFAEYMKNSDRRMDAYLIAAQRWMIDMLFSVWHRNT